MTDEPDGIDNTELTDRKQKHQRRMAWMSLYVAISLVVVVVAAMLLGSDKMAERMSKMEMFMATAVIGFLGLTGAFMGLKTVLEAKAGK